MTREEAINIISQMVKDGEGFLSDNTVEAYKMAIKALEQEPETWSLDDAREDFMHDVYISTNEEANRIIDSFDRVTSSIKQELRWIPVSERLPEDGQEILFSTKTGRVYSGKYHDDESANQWYSYKDRCRAWNNVVIAWMPLPEPYREDGDTE